MRILLVTPMPPSTTLSGAMPRLFHAAWLGLRRDHQVSLVTVAGPDPAELAEADRLAREDADVHVVRRLPAGAPGRWRRRLRVVWGGTSRRLPWRPAWCYAADAQPLIDRLMGEGRFDVVAVEDNAMAVYRYRADVPSVLTEHEVRRPRPAVWPRFGAPGWRHRMLAEVDWARWRRYQPRAWARFDVVQTFTERDAEAVEAAVPSLRGRTRVCPFGIDVPPAADPNLESPGELLFAGSMTHRPNVDAVLWLADEVLPRLWRHRPDARLTVAGPHPPPEVAALHGDRIRVVGQVPDMRPHLERAEVVLAPVRIGGGMRMKVLEAMALGKAVVTTPRGADGLGVEGRIPPVEVFDTAAGIAHATAALMSDAPARRILGRAARAFVTEHYGTAAYARRLERVYADAQEIARGRRAAGRP